MCLMQVRLKLFLYISTLLLLSLKVTAQAEFVQNKGQWPDQVLYQTALPNGNFWTERNGFTFQFYDSAILDWMHPKVAADTVSGLYKEHTYKVRFEGSNDAAEVGIEKLPHYYNYYRGADSSRWAAGCEVFRKCRLNNIYPGTDVLVYSNSSSLKYDFIVHPGSNADDIQLVLEGASVSLVNYELLISTSVNTVIERAPYAYQVIGGNIIEIPCHFSLSDNTIRFVTGEYDSQFDLIIDPEIAFSTFIGSTASNFGFTACDDAEGNLVSGAAVFAAGYPTTIGAFSTSFVNAVGNVMDVAISKFSDDGSTLLYSTYLGGSLQETPHSVVTDNQNNIIILGVTGSSDFPVSAGVFQNTFMGGPSLSMSTFFTGSHSFGTDIFITKLNATGGLAASTFLGGSENDGLNFATQLFYNYGDVFRGEINVDQSGNIFIASVTRSNDFPTANSAAPFGGGFDGVVAKLNPALTSLMYSSFIGGPGNEACYAVEFSSTGIITIAGGTQSSTFSAVNGVGADNSFNGQTDGFIARLDPTSFLLLSGTFVGTDFYDQVYFIQFDEGDNVYVYGQTNGLMPISPGLYGQPNSGQFISKYSPDLSSLVWNTTIGTGSGEIDISPTAFLVSECEQIYLSGWGGETNQFCGFIYDCQASLSTTAGLPVTADAFQSATDGSDFYLCVLSPDATSLEYGSFLGGGLSAEHVDGGTSRFNKNGTVYQAVCAGCQGNSDFPSTPGAYSPTNNSMGCNLAVFRFNLNEVQTEVEIDGPNQICVGTPIPLNNLSTGATQYLWTFGDGSTSTQFEPGHFYNEPGEYVIKLVGSNDADCVISDSTFISVTILPGVNPTVAQPPAICNGESVQLNATGTAALFWLSSPTLSATNISNPTASPVATTTYFAVDSNQCETDTVSVVVTVHEVNTTISPPATICLGQETQLQATGGVNYAWTPSTGLSNPASSDPIASPTVNTTYQVIITTAENCSETESVVINVIDAVPGNQIYPDVNVCRGASVAIMAADGIFWNWQPQTGLSDPTIQNPLASPTENTTYQIEVTNACGSGVDQVTVFVLEANVEATGGGTVCLGTPLEAAATGALTYEWFPNEFATPPTGDTTMLNPPNSMWIYVTGVDENNCFDTDSVYMNILPLPAADAGPDQYFDYPGSVYLFGNAFGLDYYWSPPMHLSCTDCIYPIASPDKEMYYTLHVTDGFGCVAVDSVLVRPYFPLWVPNSITPNGDGINDVFRAYGQNITGFHMLVFDRWGNRVFESYDINEVWTGGIDDFYVQNDIYPWVIEYDTSDRRATITGHVSVIR